MSVDSESAERKQAELQRLLNEIMAKGGLPRSAQDELRYTKTMAKN